MHCTALLSPGHHAKSLEGYGGESELLFTYIVPHLLLVSGAPSPPSFVPVKLDHSEQQELNYLPLRDDFDKVRKTCCGPTYQYTVYGTCTLYMRCEFHSHDHKMS